MQKKVQYPYDHEERVNWHFIPRDRNGVGLWDLTGDTRATAEALVKCGYRLRIWQDSADSQS